MYYVFSSNFFHVYVHSLSISFLQYIFFLLYLFSSSHTHSLVTNKYIYRESALLFKEGISTSDEKQKITEIISHEYAHQWFGNLVTPSWWQYIWLNEGFARYFQYIVASQVEPDWRLTEQVTILSVHRALEMDSADKTKPMSNDVQSPEEISGIYDVIAYDKG